MRFYFSGNVGINTWLHRIGVEDCHHRLQSCHGNYLKSAYGWLQACVDQGVACDTTMLLDSGAFTAWSLGHPITIDQLRPIYLDIWKKFEPHFKELWFINLDVIPGSRTQAPTGEQIAQSLIDSDENFRQLVDAIGERVLPVFHQGEEWERLNVCCDLSKYVCISPRQTVSEKARVAWLHNVALKVPSNIRLHGLATTGAQSIKACPWYSVDSASWVLVGGLGGVLVPHKHWVKPVSVSQESPKLKYLGEHILTMTKHEVKLVTEHAARYATTLEELIASHEYRKYMSMMVIQDAVATIKPVEYKQQGLF